MMIPPILYPSNAFLKEKFEQFDGIIGSPSTDSGSYKIKRRISVAACNVHNVKNATTPISPRTKNCGPMRIHREYAWLQFRHVKS